MLRELRNPSKQQWIAGGACDVDHTAVQVSIDYLYESSNTVALSDGQIMRYESMLILGEIV